MSNQTKYSFHPDLCYFILSVLSKTVVSQVKQNIIRLKRVRRIITSTKAIGTKNKTLPIVTFIFEITAHTTMACQLLLTSQVVTLINKKVEHGNLKM